MTRKFFSVISLVFVLVSALSQNITRQDADSMLIVLKKSKQDINHVELLLNLAEFHMFKPGERKVDLDSAVAFIGQAKQLNAVLKSREIDGHILLEESYLANEYHDRVKGKQLLEGAIVILDKGQRHYLRGKAYLALADYFDLENTVEVPDRMRAFKQAIAAFKEGGFVEREAYTYERLSETDSSVETTEQELKQALALYNSIHHTHLQGVYDLLAGVYILRSNFPEALRWGLKALKTAEAVGDTTMQLCTINNHIAIIYQLSHDSANATKYFTNALGIAEKYNDKETIYFLTQNIASIYLNNQQPLPARDLLLHIQEKYGYPEKKIARIYYAFVRDNLKVYTLLKQFQVAERYCAELINIQNTNELLNSNLSDIYVAILDYYLASGQYTRMLPYLKKDEKVAKAYGNPRNMARLYKLWFCYDTAQHDYKSAVAHLLKYDLVYTTINTEARDRAIKELQIQFDTKKKEDQINLLNNQAQLEKVNLKQATLIKNITVAGIIVALIIAGLLYRQSRLRKKNNTVITYKNDQLQHLLHEKEWLLKEIHHRVKNNLQIVMSLLNSQSVYINNDAALTAIHDSQHRVHAMSLIHQKLYSSDNLSAINMSSYIRELVSYLGDSFNTRQRIHFELNIDPLEMDVSEAVPLGLILNEAITNSIKYAFPDGRNGIISISLINSSADYYLLSIADDGIGMPSNSNSKRAGSLGLSLMQGLSEDLDGNFSIENNNGTIIKISFAHDFAVKRSDTLAALFVSNN